MVPMDRMNNLFSLIGFERRSRNAFSSIVFICGAHEHNNNFICKHMVKLRKEYGDEDYDIKLVLLSRKSKNCLTLGTSICLLSKRRYTDDDSEHHLLYVLFH